MTHMCDKMLEVTATSTIWAATLLNFHGGYNWAIHNSWSHYKSVFDVILYKLWVDDVDVLSGAKELNDWC